MNTTYNIQHVNNKLDCFNSETEIRWKRVKTFLNWGNPSQRSACHAWCCGRGESGLMAGELLTTYTVCWTASLHSSHQALLGKLWDHSLSFCLLRAPLIVQIEPAPEFIQTGPGRREEMIIQAASQACSYQLSLTQITAECQTNIQPLKQHEQ